MVNSARQEIYQEPVTMKRKREDDDLTGEASNGNNSSGSNNSGNSSKRRRGKLPQEARLELMSWLFKHSSRPYPTEEEKSNLVAATGLTQVQINNWFSNARRRILRRSKFELGGKRDIMMTDDDSDDDEGGSGDDLDTQGPSTPTSTSTMMSNATSSLASPGGGMYAGGSVPPPPTTSASPAGAIRTMPGLSPTNAARPMASSISRPMPATRPPIVGPKRPARLYAKQESLLPANQDQDQQQQEREEWEEPWSSNRSGTPASCSVQWRPAWHSTLALARTWDVNEATRPSSSCHRTPNPRARQLPALQDHRLIRTMPLNKRYRLLATRFLPPRPIRP